MNTVRVTAFWSALCFGAAAAAPPQQVKNSVLVHGAFADGSSWAKVIPLLQAKGYSVTAVQNPLTSPADDVAATQRAATTTELGASHVAMLSQPKAVATVIMEAAAKAQPGTP